MELFFSYCLSQFYTLLSPIFLFSVKPFTPRISLHLFDIMCVILTFSPLGYIYFYINFYTNFLFWLWLPSPLPFSPTPALCLKLMPPIFLLLLSFHLFFCYHCSLMCVTTQWISSVLMIFKARCSHGCYSGIVLWGLPMPDSFIKSQQLWLYQQNLNNIRPINF